MKTLLVRKRNQVTLPKEMLKNGVHEFEYEKLEDGSFHLIPMFSIPESQRYFWTKRWQEGERKASEDIKHGRFKDYDNVEELIRDLRAMRAQKSRKHNKK